MHGTQIKNTVHRIAGRVHCGTLIALSSRVDASCNHPVRVGTFGGCASLDMSYRQFYRHQETVPSSLCIRSTVLQCSVFQKSTCVSPHPRRRRRIK